MHVSAAACLAAGQVPVVSTEQSDVKPACLCLPCDMPIPPSRVQPDPMRRQQRPFQQHALSCSCHAQSDPIAKPPVLDLHPLMITCTVQVCSSQAMGAAGGRSAQPHRACGGGLGGRPSQCQLLSAGSQQRRPPHCSARQGVVQLQACSQVSMPLSFAPQNCHVCLHCVISGLRSAHSQPAWCFGHALGGSDSASSDSPWVALHRYLARWAETRATLL